jgi:phosphoenolpyruvate carboxylase
MLPGWYGFGAAVSRWLSKEGTLEELRGLHATGRSSARCSRISTWCLPKTDLAIATRYADRCTIRLCASASLARVGGEWHAARDALFAHYRAAGLPCRQPDARALDHNRFPYLDPLNHLQIELLRRYRAGDTEERTVRAIHLTINGIAATLRNSG